MRVRSGMSVTQLFSISQSISLILIDILVLKFVTNSNEGSHVWSHQGDCIFKYSHKLLY